MVVEREPLGGVDLDSFFGPVRVEWDHNAALTPFGQLPFFIHFLKASGLFDALVADCPLRYRESERAPEARRSGNGDALDARRSQALRAYRGAALRRRAAGASGDEENRQRGRDQARLQGDRREGRRRLVAPAPSRLRGAASGRALDSRRRYDDQAALWPSGRGGPGLQSQEAGASEPLLPHLFDGLDASCTRCRRLSRRRTCVQACRAKPLGADRRFAARPVAGAVARRLRLRQRGDHAQAEARELRFSSSCG